MFKGLDISAIIVAAGKSRRMGNGLDKQYMAIGNIPVLARTLIAFEGIESIDRIVLVVEADKIEYCTENIVKKYDINKVVKIVPGGDKRQQSVMNGLGCIKDISGIVITHDGARPFITSKIIEKSIEEAYINGAAVCAVPVKDTIKVSDSNLFIKDNPQRDSLYAVQTPQTFRYEILYNAHVQALKDGFTGTDDAVLVSRIGVKVKLFEGCYENIKITTPEDIYIAEAILKYRDRTLK